LKRKEKTRKEHTVKRVPQATLLIENKRKDYAFWRQFVEKPSIHQAAQETMLILWNLALHDAV